MLKDNKCPCCGREISMETMSNFSPPEIVINNDEIICVDKELK